MGAKELIRRYTIFIISIFVISLGISAVVQAKLGTSPISSSSFVFSINTPISMGSYLFFLGIILLVVQMLMLGKEGIKAKKYDLLAQLPISVLFGLFTDMAMWMLADFHPQLYIYKIITLIVGCFILAVGISLEVTAGVAMMGGEYTVQIASKRFKKEFGTVKIIFDSVLVLVAVVSSWAFTRTIEGVREGTIIAAIITGPFVRLVMPRLGFIRSWLNTPNQLSEVEIEPQANSNILITISREYGSGGHDIGEMIAYRLGIPLYDHKLIEMVAKEGDLSEKYVSSNEQNINNSLFYKMLMQDYEAPLEKSLSPEDVLFVAQSKVLNRIAEEGSCVIVGRCADYILDKYANNINIFLHADLASKTERITARYGIPSNRAMAEITRIDKARADHYNHYTGKLWGDARNYQLTCDSGLLSAEEICNTVVQMYRSKALKMRNA